MRKIKLLLIIPILCLVLSSCSFKLNDGHLERTEFLMNTIVNIDIYGTKDKEIMNNIYDKLFEIERIMSKTIKDSDIDKINKNAGKEVIVSDETYYVLEKAKKQAELTRGAFDPTIGPLVSLWKINESDEDRHWLPKEEEIGEKKKLVDYNKLELYNGNKVKLKNPNMELDLGGIVKGFATDEIIKILESEKVESAIIDLGGDLYAYGSKLNGESWKIGIQNPEIESRDYMGILSISNKSIVTSGNYERYFEKDGEIYHHIIDKNTGYPSKNELLSVTTVCDEGIYGDSYSTAFYVLGLEKSLNIIDKTKGLDAIFITKDKKVYITEGIKEDFKLRDESSGFKVME